MTYSARLLIALSLFFWFPLQASAQPAHEEQKMRTYMVFFSFTEQGIANIKDIPRVEEAKDIVRSMGGDVKAFYGILGAALADAVFIVEAPDDETVATMVLTIASRGNVRTETHPVFTENEYAKIVQAIP